jgi:hypothetical protein
MTIPIAIAERMKALRGYSSTVRASEYHLTNACNIRCKGCWFFVQEFDKLGNKSQKEVADPSALDAFVRRECERGVNTALLIGGEPTMVPRRVAVYVEHMKNVSVSTNGLLALEKEGFEDVSVAITLFGGLRSDDALRAIRPSGTSFSGLFQTALRNYRNDERAFFIYGVAPQHVGEIRPTIERIVDNGNIVSFNYYHDYRLAAEYPKEVSALLNELLELKEDYPKQIASHPYHIRALVEGEAHFGRFGYESCPSVSVDSEANKGRLSNGKKYLPKFNTWAADLKTVLKCCTSGECESCRDSQAVYSWLLVNVRHFFSSPELLATWVAIAESYWSQFTWSPYSLHKREPAQLEAACQVLEFT